MDTLVEVDWLVLLVDVEIDVLVDVLELVELVEVLVEVDVDWEVEEVEVVKAEATGVNLISAKPVDIWAVTNLS